MLFSTDVYMQSVASFASRGCFFAMARRTAREGERGRGVWYNVVHLHVFVRSS